jgi:SAM-dependent methyltransferase
VEPPLPPVELMTRVGTVAGADPAEFYLREGASVGERIVSLLPPDWSFEGRRVLDFGCGSGRVLRHFLDLAPSTELWGCDIDGGSIHWLKANLSPPLHPFQNQLSPPLEVEGESFDLIWATSVFTHIDNWSEWLAEMHRVLAPGGLLISSWLGEGVWDAMVREPYVEDQVGMTVLRHWDVGGAWVFHSEWWLREHWGRAFDFLQVVRPPRDPNGSPQITHSYVVLRKREVEVSPAELERCAPEEPREVVGLQTSLRLMRVQTDQLLSGELNGPPPRPGPLEAPGQYLLDAVRRTPLRGPLRDLRRRVQTRRG